MKEIFVFGAGFTRAFCPSAPLLEDDYDTYDLIDKYEKFPKAKQILELTHKKRHRKVNIEQLLTRLYSGMPYDSQMGTNAQIQMLKSDVLKYLLKKLTKIREDIIYSGELDCVAKHCIENEITCITLNYDTIFDEALSKYILPDLPAAGPRRSWNPVYGYGFLCKPAMTLLHDGAWLGTGKGEIERGLKLLKLHGSVNWFMKTGYQSPYPLDAIVYQEDWLHSNSDEYTNANRFVLKEPFIIPPVLMKSEITEQPLIRAIWQMAYEELKSADAITFVGYSLPVTDIAVRFLFRESLASGKAKQIKVVNLIDKPTPQKELARQYNSILPELAAKMFDFGGALKWAKRFCH